MGEAFWFKARFAWGACFSMLDDAEIASLAKSIWKLAETGEETQPIGKAAFLWPMISSEICQDAADRENGRKGGRPPKVETGDNTGGKNPPLTEQSRSKQSTSEQNTEKQNSLSSAEALSAPAVTRPKKQKADAPGFDAFWAAYPKHQGKTGAKKAWNTLAPDEDLRRVILSAIEGQKKNNPSWLEENGKYIPMPSTWLHGNRWEDETIPNSSSKFSEMDLGVTL